MIEEGLTRSWGYRLAHGVEDPRKLVMKEKTLGRRWLGVGSMEA